MKLSLRLTCSLLAVSGLFLCGPLQAAGLVTYAGGDGSTMEKAVVIKGADEMTGVNAEYTYLTRRFPGYKMRQQGVSSKDKHSYDTLEFTTAKGEKKTIYFDITTFFGKPE